MKILFVAVFTPNSTNVAQSRGFQQIGCGVYEYDYRARLSQCGHDVRLRDDDLIDTVSKLKPDVVVFSKCNNMHYRVIDECNKFSKTVLWYMDALNNFDTELIDKIKRVNLFVNGIEGVVSEGLKYNENTIFIEQCPDEEMNFWIHPTEISDYKYDTTFIGNVDPGSGTHSDRLRYKNEVGFIHFDNVYGLEHNEVVNQTKINLNFAHTSTNGASVRVMKILAAGGFLLTTSWDGIGETFNVGEHLDTFSTPQELKDKIKYYLNNETERDRIRHNGYKLVQDNYMSKHWARRILDYVK